MTGSIRIVPLALILVFLSVMLKEIGFKGVRLVGALGLATLYLTVINEIGSVFSAFASLGGERLSEYTKEVVKLVGVGYVYGISSDICSELGESGLASALNIAGRVEIIVIILPFVKRIIELVGELVS